MPNKPNQKQLDAQALKAMQERQQRENQEKHKQANKAKLEYQLKLNDLGLHEFVVLESSPAGIYPNVVVSPVSPEQAKDIRSGIEKALAKLNGVSLTDAQGNPL